MRVISWEEFSNYLISKASKSGGLFLGGQQKKTISNLTMSAADTQMIGAAEKIRPYSLTVSAQIPPKDRDKHKSVINEITKANNEEGTDKKKRNQNNSEESKGLSLNKAIYLSDLDKIAIVEERSDTIQFINPRNCERASKDLDCGYGLNRNVSHLNVKVYIEWWSEEVIIT